MSEKHMRVRAEINLDAVTFNMKQMESRIDPETQITAVIKADAYGHGAVQIAHLLENDPCLWGFGGTGSGSRSCCFRMHFPNRGRT